MNKIFNKIIWNPIFLSILYFSFLRFLFLMTNIFNSEVPIHIFTISLIHGVRFDITTIAFITLPIWLIFSIISFPKFNGILNSNYKLFCTIYCFIIIPFSTIVYIIDFGFFKEFSTRINYLVFEYLKYTDTIFKTIIQQFPYNILLISIPILLFYQIKILKKYFDKITIPTFKNIYSWFNFIIISLVILIISLRGGLQSKPLNWSHSNFSHYRLTNNICLNPVWNLGYTVKSYLNEKNKPSDINITLNESINILKQNKIINSNKIIDNNRPFLNETSSPIPRNDYNIIIILMESFAGQYIGSISKQYNISNEFDKLSTEGVLFTNMFSAGTRTNRAISSTLLSFPALPKFESIMEDASVNQQFSSIAEILKPRDYLSSFFYGGNINYDNMGGFLKSQGFDDMYGQEIYDKNSFSNAWGVSDEILFDKSYELILKQKEPFVSILLTTTNHTPYTYPNSHNLNNQYKNDRMGAFSYSDMALGKFMDKMKTSSIYDKTIFVILGDHGFLSNELDQNKSIELASYHIPCLIIAPNLKPDINNRIAGQIDIIPTILPLLGGKILHHSWGKNLLKEPKISDFALIIPSGINHIIGFIKENRLLIHNLYTKSEYYYLNGFPENINLRPVNDVNLFHLNMEQEMQSFLKLASHTLNNYRCGIKIE